RKLSALSVAPTHRPKVFEPGRMSTATSKISPSMARTSFPCGLRRCACRPRSVPCADRDWLSCTKSYAIPPWRYFAAWKVSRKKPRGSWNTSGSISSTPGSSVSTKRISPLEAVSVPAHGEEVPRRFRVLLQLDPQRADEIVHRPGRALVLRPPAAGKDVVAAQRPAARLEEEAQHLELLRAHLHRRTLALNRL